MKYVISDIHGEYDLFIKLLDKINFSNQDIMYICGDMIEKGNQSLKLLHYIYQKQNIKCIIGNHEYELIKYYQSLKEKNVEINNILLQINSLFMNEDNLFNIDILKWILSLPFFIEEEDFICVHAGIPLDNEQHLIPFNQIIKESFVYDREFKEEYVIPQTSKCIFFGHTPTFFISNDILHPQILTYKYKDKNGNNIKDYYKIHLDLGTYISHVIGCFCIDNCQCYYINDNKKSKILI